MCELKEIAQKNFRMSERSDILLLIDYKNNIFFFFFSLRLTSLKIFSFFDKLFVDYVITFSMNLLLYCFM